MQASPQPSPAPAVAQTTTPTVVTTVGPDGKPQELAVPRTQAEVEQLLRQRSELSEQLSSVSSRRNGLSEQIKSAPDGASRTGLEDRLRILDQRIVQIESDLASVGRQLSSAPAALVASTEAASRPNGGDEFEEGAATGGFFTALVLVPLVLYFARRRWRRQGKTARPSLAGETADRLERMERGMEAIAIEIERVTEGQRFVTRLLSESHAPVGASHRIPHAAAIEQEDSPKR